MSEDLTKTIPQSTDEKLTLILTSVLSMSVRVDSIDLRLGRVEQTLGTFEQRLGKVEQTVDETRPLLQTVFGAIAHLQEGQQRLLEGQQRLEEGQDILRSEFETLKRSVNHRFLILSGQVQASYTKLDERVTRLELNSNPPNSQT